MDQRNDTSEPNLPEPEPEQLLSLNTLSSMRSLIINPSTPKRTVSSTLQTLTRSLQHAPQTHHHHIFKLLTDLAAHHPSLSQLALDSLRSVSAQLTEPPTRLTAEYLDALATISGKPVELDDKLFTSICFGPSVPTRLWMVRNSGSRIGVRPALLFPVLLGLTKDPYPYVREESLEGLVRLGERGVFEDVSLVKGCYERGVQLLSDMEDCVRVSAVRVVASWGLMLAASNADTKTYWSNEVFAKLCSMARDMNMKVRVEAFNGLGKMETVSKELLMQSLSKRVIVSGKQKETLSQSTTEQFALLASNVAGALVHGVEDEFFEVRKSTCQSLRSLTILSVEFAHEALNLLVDVLNDDKVVVRLQALETIHHMAINGCLKLQEKHMHMFLGVLVDNSWEVRYAGRKILKLVKLNDLSLFKSTIDGLLKNLNSYPQDEADIFSAFSHLGRNHKKFVALIMKGISEEVEVAFEGNIEFNSARMAALLVLSISAPLLNADIGSIPPVMFSFAVTFLGRIHCAFSDVMDRDALLAYLCEKSRSTETNINHGEEQLPLSEDNAPNFAGNELIDSENQSHIMNKPNEVAQQKQPVHNNVVNYTNYILAKFPDLWPLVQSGSTNEVIRSLRRWKEELTTLTFDSSGSADALAFTLLYLRIIKLVAEVWEHLLAEKRVDSGMGELERKLGKLDTRAKELMNTFVGLSAEEELYVLELTLLTYALRLCRADICSRNFTFKRLTIIYLRVESLLKERSALPSKFIDDLGKLIHESSTSMNGPFCSPLPLYKCLKLFSLKQFVIGGSIRHRRAELSIPNNEPDHALPFVPGLTVGIPCDIALHNISSESRVWLRVCMDDGLTQHCYLDLDRFEVSGEVRKFSFAAPYYRTPKANSFTLKVCIGLESLFENVTPVQARGGPKRELVLLCKEKPVYLSKVNKD